MAEGVEVKISAFTLTTDCIKYAYPFIESIKSLLPIVDEYVVIDGGSTDGTIEAIEAIGEPKIRIVKDEDTKWEYNWEFGRFIHNFNRGYQECKGDIAVCLDCDYVIHEDSLKKIKDSFKKMYDENIMYSQYCRMNFILADRYFYKKDRTLAVNKKKIKNENLDVRWGIDLQNWGWGAEPVIYEKMEHGVIMGKLIGLKYERLLINDIKIFNYSFVFRKEFKEQKFRYRMAEKNTFIKFDRYKNLNWPKTEDEVWNEVIYGCIKGLKNQKQYQISIEEHPKIIQDRIRNLKEDQQGYSLWGNYEKAYYFKEKDVR